MIRFNHTVFLVLLLTWLCTSCSSVPKGSFGEYTPSAPDYSRGESWAALPWRKDSADTVPVSDWQDLQEEALVDVFFIHPTTYTGKPGQKHWNGSLEDKKLNQLTDEYPMRYQASVFNGVARVYAPRYRQAHFECFFTKKTKEAEKALTLAYADVYQAFRFYLDHYNEGRPFIIASHSQGTWHAKQLLKDFIDEKPLQQQFVAGYLAGLSVPADLYQSIPPCRKPDETGCFCSWRTFRENYIPPKLHFPDTNIVVTNPVTWDAEQSTSGKEMQRGGVLRDFSKVYPQLVSTSIHDDLLWVCKPHFPWSFLLSTKNYHIADYNFFYADIRHNAQVRVDAFLAH